MRKGEICFQRDLNSKFRVVLVKSCGRSVTEMLNWFLKCSYSCKWLTDFKAFHCDAPVKLLNGKLWRTSSPLQHLCSVFWRTQVSYFRSGSLLTSVSLSLKLFYSIFAEGVSLTSCFSFSTLCSVTQIFNFNSQDMFSLFNPSCQTILGSFALLRIKIKIFYYTHISQEGWNQNLRLK